MMLSMVTADLDRVRTVLRGELPRLERDFSVESLGVFGSRVRAEERRDSDLDILVRFVRKPGLLRFMELENDLSALLGVKVDLVLESALKPHIAQRVMKEVVAI